MVPDALAAVGTVNVAVTVPVAETSESVWWFASFKAIEADVPAGVAVSSLDQ
jgi:hypothetical protein